ncbi:Stk1 family PASTA domain-containing Ser/Thr kinase [Nakamurella sp. PAMC28650]|uniref:Stk1 family PASTA domain-containing Ser/Thr kinase n=1 Tax=Nakamurella sp. PAMC28650 TaxID=2762325 RepID=UPI00164EA930|nr:Stk1 family PASTA domain-containing Ser/Thr kinase [Nakamurella sp. PAMC28650]QNK79632.1 Stk1 family PASTA domain-containing Ser/Thr kinase [Nakamurella sp. PAMC28650]
MSTSDGGRGGRTLIGTVLDGRYRVGAMIARGGMSTVYRGMDLRLDRPVAIKVMKPSFAADPSFLTRFEREARSAAALAHRGVVAMYDQGRDGDIVFLVMELVDGGTLRDLIRESGGLSVAVTMSILEPLLSALGAAHAAGLVHRDVKPENVLISSRGEVKVADFGLVRAVSSQTMATGDVILGTVAYLSPEQVSTGASDARSDVYSAGIVAFEMLTGHTPYLGDNPISVAYQHVHSDVPPVTDQAPGVPLELDDLILAATRRDPFARPRDANAFLSALVALRARLGLARAVVPVPGSSRPPAVTRPVAEHVTARPAGPTGTRVVAAVGPATAELSPVLELRSTRRLRRTLVIVIVVLLVGGAAAVGGWWLGSGRWAYTPATVGVLQQSAETLVLDAGLVPHVTSAPDDTVPQGTVARTDPVTGARVLRGTEIDLVVSAGRPVVPVISAGTAVDEASQAVTAAHLTPRLDPTADRYDAAVPTGAVVTTVPAADTAVDISADVLIVLSRGPPPEPVPDVSGKSLEDAKNKLLVAGFAVGRDEKVYNTEVDSGSVIGTDPAKGQLVPAGSAVSVVIASSLEVPAVRGEPVTQAADDLRRSGFTVTVADPVFDPDVDGGSAIGTSPSAGSRVDPANPAITLTVSDAVTVPDVSNGNVGQARQQLSDLGLGLQVSALFGASGASVLSQSPSGGSRVAPNSTVRVSAFP